MMRVAGPTGTSETPRSLSPLCMTLVLLGASALAACNRSQQPAAAPRPTPATSIERELQNARRALAKNIFVISRADGVPLTAEDRAFIRQNLPLDRVYTGITDDNRQLVVSMHIDFPAENLAAIRARYQVAQVQT